MANVPERPFDMRLSIWGERIVGYDRSDRHLFRLDIKSFPIGHKDVKKLNKVSITERSGLAINKYWSSQNYGKYVEDWNGPQWQL